MAGGAIIAGTTKTIGAVGKTTVKAGKAVVKTVVGSTKKVTTKAASKKTASKPTAVSGESRGKRKPSRAQTKSRLQQARRQDQQQQQSQSSPSTRGPRQLPRESQPTFKHRDDLDADQNDEAMNTMKATRPSRASEFRAATQLLKRAEVMRAEGERTQKGKQTQDAMQEAAKQASRKKMMKGMRFGANAISTGLETATLGLGSLFTFPIRLITLGWYNIEMIFGGWISKGKNKSVDPLTWDGPIPLPLPKPPDGQNSIGKTILVLMTDFLFILALMMPFIFIGVVIALMEKINPF